VIGGLNSFNRGPESVTMGCEYLISTQFRLFQYRLFIEQRYRFALAEPISRRFVLRDYQILACGFGWLAGSGIPLAMACSLLGKCG
jgi:hypothetical protein